MDGVDGKSGRGCSERIHPSRCTLARLFFGISPHKSRRAHLLGKAHLRRQTALEICFPCASLSKFPWYIGSGEDIGNASSQFSFTESLSSTCPARKTRGSSRSIQTSLLPFRISGNFFEGEFV